MEAISIAFEQRSRAFAVILVSFGATVREGGFTCPNLLAHSQQEVINRKKFCFVTTHKTCQEKCGKKAHHVDVQTEKLITGGKAGNLLDSNIIYSTICL